MSKHLRDAKGRLLPGQAPLNPAGRPKSLRNQLEEKFGPGVEDAWACLSRIMHGQEESIEERVTADGKIIEVRRRPTIAEKADAAETAIAYFEGRPSQTNVNANVSITPQSMDETALKSRVAEILARFAASPPSVDALPEPKQVAAEVQITVNKAPADG
jgi:hypothetical protein